MVAAVLFDLDNTLIDRDAAFRELIQATFHPSTAVMDELVDLDCGGYGDRAHFFDQWCELGGGKIDLQRFGLALSRFVHSQPRLLQALCKLSETMTLAIVSNGGTIVQEAKWRAAGLDSVVPRDRLWISAEVGLSKPDPAIFHLVCHAMNVKPSDCLYVGDQPQIDIDGAQAAGLSTRLATSPLKPECVRRLGFFVNSCVEYES